MVRNINAHFYQRIKNGIIIAQVPIKYVQKL